MTHTIHQTAYNVAMFLYHGWLLLGVVAACCLILAFLIALRKPVRHYPPVYMKMDDEWVPIDPTLIGLDLRRVDL